MPEGWWIDPKILREGRDIFEGIKNEDVACHACHGRDGIPILEGARNLRDVKKMGELSDVDIFRSVSEGMEDTEMSAWGEDLSTEDIWKVIAYTNMFHHNGKAEEHAKGEILSPIHEDQPVIPVIPE